MDSTQPIVFRCACGQKIKAASVLAGRDVKCPSCGGMTHVPGASGARPTKQPVQVQPVAKNVFEPPADIILHPVESVPTRLLPLYGRHAIIGLGTAVACPIAAIWIIREVNELALPDRLGILHAAAILLVLGLWLLSVCAAVYGLIALRLWILEPGLDRDDRALQGLLSGAAAVAVLTAVIEARASGNELAWFGAYGCIVGACFIGATWIERRRLRKRRTWWACAAAAAAALISLDHFTATYIQRWTSDTGTNFADSYNRSREIFWRRLEEPVEGQFMPAWSSEGPMVPSVKPHGHWKTTTWNPFDVQHQWYWYGDEVSEGEFVLRERK